MFRSTNWVLQWGSTPGVGGRLPQLGGLRRGGVWRLDFHLPPRPRGGLSLHLVKGEVWFQTWGGRLHPRQTTTSAKWVTQAVLLAPRGVPRWAHRGGFGPTGWVAYQGDPAGEVIRPGGGFY